MLAPFQSTPNTQPRSTPMSLINTQVQPFKADAFHNGKFITVTDADLKGSGRS